MIRELIFLVGYLTKRPTPPVKPTSELEGRLRNLQDEIRDNWRWGVLGPEAAQAFETLGSRYYAITQEVHTSPEIGGHLIFIADMGEKAVEEGALLYRLKGAMDRGIYQERYAILVGNIKRLIEKLNEIHVALLERNSTSLQAMLSALDSLPPSQLPE